ILIFFIIAQIMIFNCKKGENKSNPGSQENKNKQAGNYEIPIENKFYITVKAGLRLREQPDINSKSILTIPFGSAIEINDKYGIKHTNINGLEGAWFETGFNNQKGYVFNSFQHSNLGFGGYVSYVNPKKEIQFSGECKDEFNYIHPTDSQHSSLVLFQDKSFIDVESDHGNGIFLKSSGSYSYTGDEYLFKEKAKQFKLYMVDNMLVDEKANELLKNDPEIFEKWETERKSETEPQEKMSVLICKKK
ncbi:MAG: SH3 domain-containing protein, partial [Leptospiraceae bacterium]|nr:SH3 domain-containing protein [Leptospiraceae bacterium]